MYGWLLKSQNESKDKYYRLYSSESKQANHRPKLTIVVRMPQSANSSLNLVKQNGNNTESSTAAMPTTYALDQNYPNPFNPDTRIQYQLPETAKVKLGIYNLLGSKIRTLVDDTQSQGFHTVYWDGKDDSKKQLSSGVYFYRLRVNGFVQTRKLTLLR